MADADYPLFKSFPYFDLYRKKVVKQAANDPANP